ncbi:hypothetical protein QTP70_028663 [Hemibagrus guttatus]|uniref:POF1B helix-loop-helix domain-containing protein n=1 Tax=Hemibagrus guttatus TaxID=175788 RepID=A0AAE0QMS5_9TELE|nr:hypothetical protein QTP70_028663 [Hemibagrus guttatus]
MTLPSAYSTSTLRTVSVASEPSTTTLLSSGQLGMTGGTTLRTVGVASEPSTTTLLSSGQLGMTGGTTLRTVGVASEPGTTTLLSSGQLGMTGGTTLRTVGVAPAQFSSVQYVNGAVDGTALHGNVRYLVPVNMQRSSESYVMVNQAPQMLTPVYLQNLQSVQRVSVSSLDESDSVQQVTINGQASVFSQPSSPIKSPEPPESVQKALAGFMGLCKSTIAGGGVEGFLSLQNVSLTPFTRRIEIHSFSTAYPIYSRPVESSSVQEVIKMDMKTDFKSEPVAKLDTRYFGELLAEVYRKNCDIHTCVSEHVSKISGRKHLQDYKEKEDIEYLIPKGVSELTKQQIRYLLQTRMTADMTMRMLLNTFSSLKEDLAHLQDDLKRLESEKEQLERDLSFKAEQAVQYDRLLEGVRENNRQLQISLKESSVAQRNMETQLMSTRSTDSSKDFRIKDLEGSKRALEQENELLRKKLEGRSSDAALQTKTQELSRHYEQMLKELREEKNREITSMRSQLVKIQTEYTTERSSDKSLQLRITELLTTLEHRESTIKRQEEEIRRLKQEKNNNSGSQTETIVTKRYETQYPILGLLSDDYHYTPSPVRESKTIVIKKTGEMTKKGYTA